MNGPDFGREWPGSLLLLVHSNTSTLDWSDAAHGTKSDCTNEIMLQKFLEL